MIIFLILLAVAVLFVVLVWSIYNKLIQAQNVVDEAFSGIDVQLKRRFTLIPSLVAATKAYNAHEAQMLEKIVAMRSGNNLQETAQKDQTMTSALNHFKITVEDYPELKANTQFLKLMDNLSAVENDLSLARRYYNGTVRDYTTKTEVFPAVLVAKKFGFKGIDFYEINETEKNVPTIDLN